MQWRGRRGFRAKLDALKYSLFRQAWQLSVLFVRYFFRSRISQGALARVSFHVWLSFSCTRTLSLSLSFRLFFSSSFFFSSAASPRYRDRSLARKDLRARSSWSLEIFRVLASLEKRDPRAHLTLVSFVCRTSKFREADV